MAILAEVQLSHPLSKFKHKVTSLIDTGNNFYNLISPDILNKHDISYLPVNKIAYSIDLSTVKIIGQVELEFNFNQSTKTFKELFYIPEHMSDVINLGAKFLKENKINILLDKNVIQIENHTIPLYNNELVDKKDLNSLCISKIETAEIPSNDLPGLKYNSNKFFKYLEGTKVNLRLLPFSLNKK